MIEVNLPHVVAEVTAAFEAYERALADNDVDRLAETFWDSDLAVRYGVNADERNYGAEAIRASRRAARPLPAGRRIGPTVVLTFGEDVACVSTEFRYPDRRVPGRQSQTWIRTPAGWRIAAAHVSLPLTRP